MQLTKFTDYGIRTLLTVAQAAPELISVSKVAEQNNISRNHLTKVANKLVSLGYLESVRGKYGGLRLGMPLTDIPLGHLVRQLEPDFNLVACMGDHQACTLLPTCGLPRVLQEATAAFLATLDHYTLASVAKQPDMILVQ
ncbi:Rrf2 family transcriptional regulator [Salinibius halmophilus]|uniref:Rrf2 family transcriptional regulator n=1 Tax=Salinibius halmophilus TaxID=1853216 RepID=UPI000E662D72|nr:Rrf2 family transcriptional regulator [Salinibius halmophilus]